MISRFMSAVSIEGSGLTMLKSTPPSNRQSIANWWSMIGQGRLTAGVLNGASHGVIGFVQALLRERNTHAPTHGKPSASARTIASQVVFWFCRQYTPGTI